MEWNEVRRSAICTYREEEVKENKVDPLEKVKLVHSYIYYKYKKSYKTPVIVEVL